jgi:hypothetical protein
MFVLQILLCLQFPDFQTVDSDIFSRGLTGHELSAESILSGHSLVSSNRSARYASKKTEVLTFITPWHSIGYNLTLEFGSKFTTIVPVWFEMKVNDTGFIFGGHDAIMTSWLAEMRVRHPTVRIVPRMLLDVPVQVFAKATKLFTSSLKAELAQLIQVHQFDGVFLEMTQLFGSPQGIELLPSMIAEIRKALPRSRKIYADIINDQKLQFGRSILPALKPIIDKLDYAFVSCYELPLEPSLSPMYTITRLLEETKGRKLTAKTIVGLPFFGFDFSGTDKKHIFGDGVLDVLKSQRVGIRWDDTLDEHEIFYSDGRKQHSIYYPSPAFLKERFDLCVAEKFAGFGFWELAQGMPYFFDLL